MNVKSVYLDSSAIVKRYVAEKGSKVIDKIYDKAENSQLKIVFSIWNIGEVIGVFDRYFRRGWLSRKQLDTRIFDFIYETIKFIKMGLLQIAPLTAYELVHSWLIVMEQHIYVADAIQICTCKRFNCDLLLSADETLVEVASNCDLFSLNVETQEKEIYETLL